MNLGIASLNVNSLNVQAKRRAIYEQLRSSKADLCLIQETHCVPNLESIWASEWGGRIIFSNGSSNSRGVAILFGRNFTPSVNKILRDGRLLLVDFVFQDETYTLACCYAPTQDRPHEQAAFMDSFEAALDEMSGVNLILGGDLNCIIDPTMDKNSPARLPAASDQHRNRLRTLMENHNLLDIYRIRFPKRKTYTFRRGAYASRVDLILLSTHLSESASPLMVTAGAHSDHSMVSLLLENSVRTRGPGLWKLNPSLLENSDYLEMMESFLSDWVAPPELENPCNAWEWLKYEIKRISIQFSRDNIPAEKQMIKDLTKELQSLSDRFNAGEDLSNQIESVKRELREVEEIRANKLIMRARTRWVCLGEKPSSYYLNLEKKKSRDKTLSTVMLNDGSSKSDPVSILKECGSFYENLYSENRDDLMPIEEITDALDPLDHPRLSDQDAARLDSPISLEELKAALTELNKNKCPGSDGLCPEFYIRFWDLVSPHLFKSLSYSVDNGLLSTEQRRGVITLVPKKDVDRRLVANWRPITLLNTDYKILTKVMALRLQTVLDTIVNKNQTGFMKGRFIGDNIRVIHNAIHILGSTKSDGFLAVLDFTKAFDSVRWEFIVVALEWFGFGQRFVSLVKLISANAETCVIKAGFSSRYFKLARGIRQGCCVSPYLFLLAVEVMAICIRNNRSIQGLDLGGNTLKIVQFADDSTCFLRNRLSLTHLLSFLQIFSRWSGLVINKSKSVILTPHSDEPLPNHISGIPVAEKVKILGIWFMANRSSASQYEWNFKPQLLKIKSVCDSWAHRNTSIKGKITIVNSLLVSLLQYPCASIHTPIQVFKEYRRLVTNFIWNGKKPKVAYCTLTLPISQGGLNLMDLEVRVKVSLLQWIRRFIRSPQINAADSLSFILGTSDLQRLLSYKSVPSSANLESCPFYGQMFSAWQAVHAFEPAMEAEVRNEIVWCNHRIISEGSPIHWPRWENAGILTINDICHEREDRILSHQNWRLALASSAPSWTCSASVYPFRTPGDPCSQELG